MEKKSAQFPACLRLSGGRLSRAMRLLLGICLLAVLRASGQENETSSVDKRLTITGGDSSLRVAMVQDADDLIADFQEVVGETSGKPFPIYLQLHPEIPGEPSRVRQSFFKVPEGEVRYRLQIDLWLGAGNAFDRKKLERLLLKMLVIERTLRALPPEENVEQVKVRPWLLDGLLEAMAWRRGRGDRRMYASLMESGGWMEVGKLVDRTSLEGLDVLSRELFRASSGALVMALLSQTQGQESMRRFLGSVAVFEGEPLSLLRTHFPEVNLGQRGLERWWMLQVAAMSEKRLTEAMTIPETEERLEKVLELHLKDDQGKINRVGLDSWRMLDELENREERIQAVQGTSDLLAHLSFRCFPTYRPVIRGYLELLADLANGKTQEIETVLANLRTYRDAELRRHAQLVDLLDWYHLANVTRESGEFEDYLRVRENLRKSSGQGQDAINRYVDKVQAVFEAR
jgi:hypothetical protein